MIIGHIPYFDLQLKRKRTYRHPPCSEESSTFKRRGAWGSGDFTILPQPEGNFGIEPSALPCNLLKLHFRCAVYKWQVSLRAKTVFTSAETKSNRYCSSVVEDLRVPFFHLVRRKTRITFAWYNGSAPRRIEQSPSQTYMDISPVQRNCLRIKQGALMYRQLNCTGKLSVRPHELAPTGVKHWGLTWAQASDTCPNHTRLVFKKFHCMN
jgi:hypothetical protein